jgi:hypothetical protein
MTESPSSMTTAPVKNRLDDASTSAHLQTKQLSGKRWHRAAITRSVLFTSVLFSWLICAPMAQAQEDESYNIGGMDQDIYTLTEPAEELAEGGFGAWFQGGYTAGQSIDLEEGNLNFEASPYMFVEEGMFFGSARFFRTNTADWGGSGGLGYRHYFQGIDRMLGASIWYDRDGSRGSIFEQVGASFETLGNNFDFRTNLYYPVGTKERQLDLFIESGSFQFQDYNLLYDQTRVIGEALKGLDMEIGLPIKQEVAERHNIRAYAGWYYFLSDNTDDVIGWKTRLEANPIPSVTMDVQLQDDEVFGTSVNFSVAWTFDPHNTYRSNWHRSTWDRMTTPVKRNRAVVVSNQNVTEEDIVAINPVTGLPYIIRHVNSAAGGGGDGTFENPFDQITDATTQGGNNLNYDIVYVHADSIFNGADAGIVTDAGKRMLGEGDGITHFINIAGFGNRALPRATTGVDRPQLINAPADGLELASGSEFSGFIIDNPGGNGVVIDNTNGGTMRFVDINNAGGNGIIMTNPTGNFIFESVNIADSVGNAFEVNGGNANVTYSGSTISNTGGGRAVEIDGTTGGFINMTGTTIEDENGQGILITNTAGSVTIDTATITDSTTTGVDINNTSGRVSFIGITTIDNAAGVAMNISDIAATSVISMNRTTINNRNDTGINLERIAGDVSFVGATDIGATVPTAFLDETVFAIDFQESTGNVTFNSIDITGGTSGVFAASGIRVGELGTDNSGTFSVLGAVNMDALFGPSILIQDDDSIVRFSGPVDIEYTIFDDAIRVQNNRGAVFFGGNLTMDGTLANAILLQNNSGGVSFNTVDITSGLKTDGVVISNNNTGAVSFQTLNIENVGDSLVVFDTDSFSILQGGIIDNELGVAVQVDNSDININLTQVIGTGDDTNPLDAGIIITDSTGSFEIDGGNGQSSLTDYSATAIFLSEFNNLNDSVDADDDEVLSFLVTDMLLEANSIGLFARNIDEIVLDGMQIEESINEGVLAINTRVFALGNSSTENNGGLLDNVIDLRYNTVRTDDQEYEVYILANNLNNNGFNEDLNTIINIQATTNIVTDTVTIGPSGDGINSDTDDNEEMDIYVQIDQGNIFTLSNDANIDDLAAINIEWNGRMEAIIGSGSTAALRNIFNLGAIGMDGDLIGLNIVNNTSETDEDTDILIQNNQFQINADEANTTVMNFEIDSELDVLINNNVSTTLTQSANISSFGLVFDVGADSDIAITNNTLAFGTDAGTAILFDRIQGPSRVNISSNIFTMQDLNLGGPLEQGVIFNSIFGTVTLQSTSGNTFNIQGFQGTETIFQAPLGSTTGSILINGVNFP